MRIRGAPLTIALAFALLSFPGATPAQRAAEAEAMTNPMGGGEEAVAAPAGESGEVAVEATPVAPEAVTGENTVPVDELERLISLPPTAQLGREADFDPSKPKSLFEDPDMRKRLGEKPPFIYFPLGVDPMIIPWVRNQVIARELLEDAQKALSRGDEQSLKQARDLLAEIMAKYDDTAEALQAKPLAEQVGVRLAKLSGAGEQTGTNPQETPVVAAKAQLPQWLVQNTAGVIVDVDNPAQSVVLVGDYILRVGDAPQRFPMFKIKEILPGEVVYESQGEEYLVPVKGLGGD